MPLVALQLRDFRSYEQAQLELGESLTVLHGANGAGKSNAIEAICFACTARSPRTRNDRELIRFGATAARVELTLRHDDEAHTISVGFGRHDGDGGLEKRIRCDGVRVQRVQEIPDRPLVAVFMPDRLALIAGPPALRRSHLDNLLGAMWPARVAVRADYSRALAQRNALIARIRAGAASQQSLASWDAELARHAIALTSGRAAAVEAIAAAFEERCETLGLAGRARLEYRPSLRSDDIAQAIERIHSGLAVDLQRGYTTHGPHRDELAIVRGGRQLRTYGSQGERRLALLALLLAERAALAQMRSQVPTMLLDDALSELDSRRRELLLSDLAAAGGQSVIATTDPREVAGWPLPSPRLIAAEGAGVLRAQREES